MRITVQWLNEEKRVLHIIYHAGWDWEDFAEHRRQAQALTKDIPYQVATLMEYDRDASLLPPNALRNLSIAAETSNPDTGLIVMVMPSQFWRVVIVLLKRLLPHTSMKNSYIVNTREDAIKLLDQGQEDISA